MLQSKMKVIFRKSFQYLLNGILLVDFKEHFWEIPLKNYLDMPFWCCRCDQAFSISSNMIMYEINQTGEMQFAYNKGNKSFCSRLLSFYFEGKTRVPICLDFNFKPFLLDRLYPNKLKNKVLYFWKPVFENKGDFFKTVNHWKNCSSH